MIKRRKSPAVLTRLMPMLPKSGLFAVLTMAAATIHAHGPASAGPSPERHIQFPDTAQYQTLVLDLHTHSVFSDGHVWPTIRVSEALRDGLDGLAITEHLEFQPHLADIPHPDRNRAYEEALRAAQGHPLEVIPGVEITRIGAPGHINAVFVKDANQLVQQRSEETPLPSAQFETEAEAIAFSVENSSLFKGAHEVEVDGKTLWRPFPDPGTYEAIMNFGLAIRLNPMEVLRMANRQGAFVFWNHPDFVSEDVKLNDFHRSATRSGLLHGVEIANGDNYYEHAHRLAMEHDLALIGVSDVHELIEWDYRPEAEHSPGHRPVTLVLAEGPGQEEMKKALFAKRTVVWWKNTLIGREPHIDALLSASLSIESVGVNNWRNTVIRIRNHSDATFKLRQTSQVFLASQTALIEIEPNGVTELTANISEMDGPLALEFEVLNALVAPHTPASLTLTYDTHLEKE